MLLTQLVTTTIAVVFPPGTTDARPRLLLTAQIVLTGLCVYTNGWGSLLAVGFVFAAASAIHADGSRYAVWAMVLTALTVAAGETTVALGWLKSMVPQPEGHGLALLEVAGTCAVIWILAYNQKEKERVESSLRRSERRFRALVQHASDIIMVVAADGSLSYASPAFEGILGYPPGEAAGMEARSLMKPEDVSRFHRLVEETPEGGNIARAELTLRHRDGTWLWFESTFTNLFDDPGIEGWVANLRDITERRQSDAALRQAQEVFRHAFDEAGIGMTLVDPAGRIIRSNDAMAQMLRYRDRGSLEGVRLVEITHPDDAHAVGADLQADRRRRQRRLPHRDPARCAPTARRCGSR